jgi:hypothetical protein
MPILENTMKSFTVALVASVPFQDFRAYYTSTSSRLGLLLERGCVQCLHEFGV